MQIHCEQITSHNEYKISDILYNEMTNQTTVINGSYNEIQSLLDC